MIQNAGFLHPQRVILIGGHNGGTTAPENQLSTTFQLSFAQESFAQESQARLNIVQKADATKCGCVAE